VIGALRRTRALGRAAEVAAIEEALEGGDPRRLLLLAGEPGIGKSTLVAVARTMAESRGGRTVRAAAVEGGQPPLWPWRQLQRRLDGHAEAEPSAASLAERLTLAARGGPLLVVLEDLQDADPADVALLDQLAAELGDERVVLLGTYRDGLVGTSPALQGAVDQLRATASTLELSGLEAPDVGELLAREGVPRAHRQAESFRRASAGNPLLISLLVRAGITSTDALWRGEPPEELRAHVRRRLQPLPPGTRSLLETAATQARITDVEVVAAVAGMSEERVLDELGPAEVDGVLELDGRALRFRHAIVRASIYADLSPVRRVRLHGRSARAMAGLGRAGTSLGRAEIAHHAYHSAVGDADHRVLLVELRAAAEDARRAGGDEEARALLAHAADAAEAAEAAPEARAALLLDLADAQERSGQPVAASRSRRAAARLARSGGDALLLARSALATARAGFPLGLATSDHIAELEEALEVLPPDRSAVRAMLLGQLAVALDLTPERERGAELAEQAEGLARDLGDPEALAVALLARHHVLREPEHAPTRLVLGQEALAAAAAAGADDLVVQACSAVVADHRALGDADGVAAATAALRVEADERRNRVGGWAAATHDLVSALLAGDRPAARRAQADAETRARTTDRRSLTDFARLMTDLEPLTEEDRALVRAGAEHLPEIPSWRARAVLDAAERGDGGAAEQLAGLVALLRDPRRRCGHWLLTAALAAEAAVQLDDADRARTLHELLLPHADRVAVGGRVAACRGPVRAHLGALALCAGQPGEAVEHLRLAEVGLAAAGHAAHLPRIRAALDRARRLQGGATPRGARLGVLRRSGAGWTLEAGGTSVELADRKGLRYLAHLLSHPHQELGALQLQLLEDRPLARAGEVAPTLDADATMDSGGDALLDATAKRAFRRRLRELAVEETALGGPDAATALRRVREERAAVEQALREGTGLGGRDRRLPSPSERARTSVTKALRSAVDRIRGTHPQVAAHLDEALRTGARCCYEPGPARLTVEV
jgi:hypothetical protein